MKRQDIVQKDIDKDSNIEGTKKRKEAIRY